MTVYVVRATYVQPDGVGWLTQDGHITSDFRCAQKYDSEDAAWLHAACAEVTGFDDEKGPWAWVEELPE